MLNKSIYILLIALLSCSHISTPKKVIKIEGSTSFLPIIEVLANEYMSMNQDVIIYLQGGGSEKGIENIRLGHIDIALISRQPYYEELSKTSKKTILSNIHIIAKDKLYLLVSLENPINDISKSIINDLFTCKIKNWNEIANYDEEVVLISRQINSGSTYFLEKYIMEGKHICEESIIAKSATNVVNLVELNKGGIGYTSIVPTGADVKILTIDGIDADISDDYPLNRYLYLYTDLEIESHIARFIEWCKSIQASNLLIKNNYTPAFTKEY